MTVPRRRRALTIAVVVAGALAAPAAAQAATYTVGAGQGTCQAGGPDLACETLGDAAGAVGPNDTVNIGPGTYAGANFTDGGLTINAAAAGVVINSTMTFSAVAGGPTTLKGVGIGVASGNGINVTSGAGVVLSDSLVAAAGNGIVFSGGTANQVLRSTVLTAAATGDAVNVTSNPTSPGDKALTVDSSILTGGAAALAVRTSGAGVAGVTLNARHVTLAGSTNGVVLNASQALLASGSINSTINDSIVLNGIAATSNKGLAGLLSNTVTSTVNRNLETGDPAALFVNPAGRNFRLRSGSPAIDKAGVTAGESATDVNGDARPGPVTDAGADEFVNSAPTARASAATPTGRQTRPVTFNATGSSDPDGPIAEYRWSFSDGSNVVTRVPTVQKAFTKEGPATATLVVVDLNGVASAPASAQVTILDGLAPLISIDKPKANQTIALVKKVTRTVTTKGVKRKVTRTRRTKIAFAGRTLDRSGVAKIVLSLRQVSRASTKKKATKKKAKSSATQCRWLSPSKGMVVRSCRKPVLITAKLAASGKWTYTVPSKRKLTAGRWEVTVAGTDKAGIFGNLNPKAKVRFKLK